MGDGTPPMYVAEFVGTFFLVTSVAYNVALKTDCTWAPLSIACTLMVMVFSFGKVSGANFNPAVSLAVLLQGKGAEAPKYLIYMVVQIVAGLCAGLLLKFGAFTGSKETLDLGNVDGPILMAEFFYSLMLCYVVLNVAVVRSSQFFGCAIGFVVVAGGYGAGKISAGCFNPAIAIGLFVGSGGVSNLQTAFIYAGVELAAAACAFGLSKVANEYHKHLNELLGTFFLVLTVGLNVAKHSCAPVLSIASCLMCMVFAGAPISGGQYNPAVTVAILCRGGGKITPRDVGFNILAQLLGGVLAALVYTNMVPDGDVSLLAAHGAAPAYIGEFLATFVLCNTVLCIATFAAGCDEYVGLAVGMSVMAFGTAVGGVSGGSLNPAVTLSVYIGGVLQHEHVFSHMCLSVLAYVASEIAGGVLAAGIFKLMHPEEKAYEPLAASK
jgi:aquaporin Z